MISENKLCNFLETIISEKKYEYLIPIEQKGIFLVKKCMRRNIDKYKNVNVKPLNIHKNYEMVFEDGTKILLFDDTCYTGNTFLQAINKIKGNNLIIDKAAYLIRSTAKNLVNYYYESIDECDWFNDKRPLELKYLKIESIPYLNSYPTIKLTISNVISKNDMSKIMIKQGFSKYSEFKTENITLYEKTIKRHSNCSIIKSKINYEILLYLIGTNIFISFITDNDNEINSDCKDNSFSEFSILGCFDCEYLEFINTYFYELYRQIQSNLLECNIKIVDQDSNFKSIFNRHEEKDLASIIFLLNVLFK